MTDLSAADPILSATMVIHFDLPCLSKRMFGERCMHLKKRFMGFYCDVVERRTKNHVFITEVASLVCAKVSKKFALFSAMHANHSQVYFKIDKRSAKSRTKTTTNSEL